MKPRLIIEQKITAFVNRYEIYQADENGNKGKGIAFAEQKRLALKEKVSFFDTSSKDNMLFTFRAEKITDVRSKYFVEDAEGNVLGVFKKQFGKSLVRSTWTMLDTHDNTLLTVSESNEFLAAARRFAGWIPLVGELFELLMNFFRYHFSFRTPDGEEVGMHRKTTLFRDHYQLDVTDGAYATQDWRVFAAMAVALDALQSR